MKRYLIQITLTLAAIALFVSGCNGRAPSEPLSSQELSNDKAPEQKPGTHVFIHDVMAVGGDGEPIELINNPAATNPAYGELLVFIKKDITDWYSYIVDPPEVAYTSGDFAEDVHNNAEAAGIRAAWVRIDIDGENREHACNAFETTDMGIVYIDCTGKGF